MDLPRPTPKGKDILVEVKAILVNPVDEKVRQGAESTARQIPGQWKVSGWDAAGDRT